MTQSKHTLGPWHSKVGNPTVEVCHFRDGREYIVARVSTRQSIDISETEIHDGQLIAAAPELLEALQLFAGVENFNGWHDKYREAIEKARKAINKATGV